jgi:hypothetical protein
MNGIQFGGQMCLAMFTQGRRGTGIEAFGADIGGAACLRGRPASLQRANDLVTKVFLLKSGLQDEGQQKGLRHTCFRID